MSKIQQFTREQAVACFETGMWKDWNDKQIVTFQLYQDKLCMPFERFHQAIEAVLGRSVWTHEFADAQTLRSELNGDRPAPTFQEILDLIPEDKRILVRID